MQQHASSTLWIKLSLFTPPIFALTAVNRAKGPQDPILNEFWRTTENPKYNPVLKHLPSFFHAAGLILN